MKKLIRHSVFETNSSSCHSLTISHNNYIVLDTLPIEFENGLGVCYIKGQTKFDDFGSYNDAETKINYIFGYIMENLSDSKDKYIESLVDVIKEHLQCDMVVFQNILRDLDYLYLYYVSENDIEDEIIYLLENKDKLKLFLFNGESEIEKYYT